MPHDVRKTSVAGQLEYLIVLVTRGFDLGEGTYLHILNNTIAYLLPIAMRFESEIANFFCPRERVYTGSSMFNYVHPFCASVINH